MSADSGPNPVGVPPADAEFADSVSRAGARTLAGSAWATAQAIAPYVFTTVVSIVAARVLGPGGMGRQSFISFIVLATITLCSAGIPTALPRFVAEQIGAGREGVLRSLNSWAWRVVSITALVAFGLLAGVAAAGAQPRTAWLLGGVAAATSVLHKVPGSMLNGAQRWRVNSALTVALGAAGTVTTVIALLLGGGITSIFAVLAATNVLLVISAWAVWRRLLARIQAPRVPLGPLGRDVFRFAVGASVPVLMSFLIFQRSEFFFLDHYSSDSQIALYSIAFSVYASALALPNAISSTFAPAVATLLGAEAHDRIRSGYGRGLRLLLLVTVPLTAAALVFGPPLVRFVYGHDYSGAGELLLVLAAPLPLVPLGGISNGLLFGYRHVRMPIVIGLAAGVIDLGLAALLVPHLDAMGAAIANVGAQLVAAGGTIFACVRLIGGVDLLRPQLARLVVASAVAAGIAQLVLEVGNGPGSFLVALGLAALVFGTLAVWLRVLSQDDADWIAGAVAGKRGERRITALCRRLSGQLLVPAR
jgi:O-antigen/teichoic acid export membrane protein